MKQTPSRSPRPGSPQSGAFRRPASFFAVLALVGAVTMIPGFAAEQSAIVDLSGAGVAVGNPPAIEVDPESLASTLDAGGSETRSLTLSNLGDEPLAWTVTEKAPKLAGVREPLRSLPPRESPSAAGSRSPAWGEAAFGTQGPAATRNPLLPAGAVGSLDDEPVGAALPAAFAERKPLPLMLPGEVQASDTPYDAAGAYRGVGEWRDIGEVLMSFEDGAPRPRPAGAGGRRSEVPWEWVHPLPSSIDLNSVDFVDADTGWAVGYMDTILHTTDGGVHWEIQLQDGVGGGLPPGSIYPYARFDDVQFLDADTGWVVGGGGSPGWTGGTSTDRGAILRTNDGGATWTPQEFAFPEDGYGWIFDAHFVDANHGWAVGRCCDDSSSSNYSGPLVLRTSNGGQDWEDISRAPGLPDVTAGYHAGFTKVFFVDDQRGWLVTPYLNNVVFRTDDGGDSWTNVTNDLDSDCVPTAMTFTSATDGYLIACGNNNTANFVWKTTDAGNSWTSHFVPTLTSQWGIEFADADNGYTVGGGILARTTDAGETWTIRGQWQPPWGAALSLADGGQIVTVVGNIGGIERSEDGGASWTSQVHYLTLGAFGAVDFADDDPNTAFAVGSPDPYSDDPLAVILRTSDAGASWVRLTHGISGGGFAGVAVIDTATATAVGTKTRETVNCDGTTSGRSTPLIVRTIDGGASWVDQSPAADPDPCAPTIPGLRAVSFVDADTGWAVGWSQTDRNRVLRTTDGGATWTELAAIPDDELSVLRDTYFLDDQTGWIVGSRFNSLKEPPYSIELILRTDNGGESWVDQTPGLIVGPGRGANAVFFFDHDIGVIAGDGFAGTGSILRTTDGGATWTAAPSMDVATPRYDLACAGSACTTVGLGWADGYPEIYRSEDKGMTWTGERGIANTGLSGFHSVAMSGPETALATAGGGWNGQNSIIRRRPAGPPDCTLPGWIDVAPTSGTVPGGEAQVVAVTFDTSGLEPGTFYANLCLASNDPEQPLTVVPLTLRVNPAGGPDFIFANGFEP